MLRCRLTHDQKYRDWAWEAVEAIDKHARCGDGYCTVNNVFDTNVSHNDAQEVRV